MSAGVGFTTDGSQRYTLWSDYQRCQHYSGPMKDSESEVSREGYHFSTLSGDVVCATGDLKWDIENCGSNKS